ncbi:uncharacterized protein [Miscanthus floridulus]|uniref:uncharacterized protein isoform X2 n=1 Tax=Miscanthus floridulus TaxID=154761 RepID=UPI00345AD47A
MASSLEDLTTKFDLLSHKFESFQDMMKESLDKWSRMEAWRMTADESFGALLHQTTTVAERADTATAPINQLEHHPPPPPPPLPLPPSSHVLPLHQAFPAAADLNRLVQDHRVLGEGILGTLPCPVTGFIQKIIKGDLFVKGNYGIPPRKQYEKILEDSRMLSTETDPEGLPCGAGRPACRSH